VVAARVWGVGGSGARKRERGSWRKERERGKGRISLEAVLS